MTYNEQTEKFQFDEDFHRTLGIPSEYKMILTASNDERHLSGNDDRRLSEEPLEIESETESEEEKYSYTIKRPSSTI